MIHRFPRLVAALTAAAHLSGCSTFDPPAARPGLSAQEARALRQTYYWQPHFPVPAYSDAELHTLLAHSTDPALDGEGAELQTSAVALALAVVGDARFAAALSGQPPTVRRAVADDIAPLWKRHRLRYPETQAVLRFAD